MTFTRRDPRRARNLDPAPAEVLTKTEIRRLAHWKQVDAIEASFKIEGPEARRFAERLLFLTWRYWSGKCSEWSR